MMKEQPKNYINEDGDKFWYLPSKGKHHYHRLDGPAIEYSGGQKEWWVDGKLHRIDGPSAEYINGVRYWYINGQRHRENGPAVELSYGVKEWWLNDKLVCPEDWFKENGIDPNNMTEEDAMAFKLGWL